MEKSKNRALGIAIWVILVGAFNAVVFLVAKEKTPVFWIGYGFAMLAFVMQLITAVVICGKNASLHAAVVGIPLINASWMYLVLQLILSIVLMLVGGEKTTFPWILEILLTAFFLILLILTVMAKDYASGMEKKVAEKRFYLGSLQTDVQAMADRAQDAGLKKALNDLYETVRYSDPMSHESLAPVENKISNMIAMLDGQIEQNDAAAARETILKIEQAFADRNRKCRMLK